ncbi:MAG: mechanosensitive ion channel [Verrucomicrobiota bacterium JB023]|nr:mechanosensitive ion channel [Verrucomicrobiota bacterium JB023]
MAKTRRTSFDLLILMLLLAFQPLSAQSDGAANEEESDAEKVQKRDEMALSDLGGILESYRVLRQEQNEAREKLDELKAADPPDEEALVKAEAALTKLTENLGAVRERIREVAQGDSFVVSAEDEEDELNFSRDFKMLLDPLLDEVRETTESTRKLTELTTEVDDLSSKKERLGKSLSKVQQSAALVEDEQLRELFDDIEKDLRNDLTRVEADLTATELQVKEIRENTLPIYERIGQGTKTFLTGRGRSLLLAVVLSLGLFWLLNGIQRRMFRRLGKGRKAGSTLAFRLAELLFTIFRFGVAIGVAFLVFMLFDDWLLVTLTILIILGILWGAKETIFRSYEKVQLLLNLGPVRQGERVTYEGLPYEVRSLSFYPLLENPALSNSARRITIDELATLRMRHEEDEEPWFVTEKGDWVSLSDGTFGQVIFQSPERVRIQDLGGQIKTIPTGDYLSMNPTNYKTGYALASTFGIDYKHQHLDYNLVATTFAAKIREKLLEFLPEEEILATFSAFKQAGASSLDYLVVAKVTGEAASKRFNIERALQQACLDACNENGWGIPFPQLTIHQGS